MPEEDAHGPSLREEYLDDPEVAKVFRSSLEEDIRGWKLEWLKLDQENRTKQSLLVLAGTNLKLRVSTVIGARDGRTGQPIDFNNAAKNELKNRIGQIVYQMELLEHSIDDARATLAAMPEGLDPGQGSPDPESHAVIESNPPGLSLLQEAS